MITAHNKNTYEEKLINGFRVHYLAVPYENSFGPLKKILAFRRFAKAAYKKAAEFKDADLVYASSTPLTVGFVAMQLKKNLDIPFYFEVRDLWPEAPIQLGVIRNYLIQKYLYKLENRIYQHATKIIALSPGIQDGILNVVSNKDVEMIPNMSDCSFLTMTEKSDALLNKYNINNDRFIVTYTGSLGIANRVEFLLNIAEASMAANQKITFVIAGKGSESDFLKNLARQKNLNNIIFIEHGDKNFIKEILNISDATYTCFDTKSILETNSPNKFFDSLAAGKLSIVNTKGWLKELVEKNECGFYADPLNPSDFLKKMMPFIKDKERLKRCQQNARALAEREFSVEKLTKKFLKII
jgi:glycosyltransferase involved in cell wall biosynthesis